jgi:hypothetical protein
MCHNTDTRTIMIPHHYHQLTGVCPAHHNHHHSHAHFLPFQVRAVITTKGKGVGPYEQLTWYYDMVSSAKKACDTMVDETVLDLPSQQDTGGATGPSQEEQSQASGTGAHSMPAAQTMSSSNPSPAQPDAARPCKKKRM